MRGTLPSLNATCCVSVLGPLSSRRLRDLKSAPRLKGLQRLIKDVRAVGGQTPGALRSALMLAARGSGFDGRSLDR